MKVLGATLTMALVLPTTAIATSQQSIYRPSIHFTPPTGWINDPNGLVRVGDTYHLFYQHNPDDIVWGPMHWGHATSEDLLTWIHQPIALFPDEIGTIFSGSAVIDHHNSAGFGEGAMVAAFTHFSSPRQMQSLAYSTDQGHTWQKHEGNPVLQPPSGIRNFRDPRVFHWDRGSGDPHWVMAVGSGLAIIFYRSPDLRNWSPMSTVGPMVGATCGVWETPDLIELPIAGTSRSAWVLTVATSDCSPSGGSGVQYFVGDFDGERFVNANDDETELWADWGPDFYAPQTWGEVPDRAVWIGWMSSWQYAQAVPASTWRGSMSIPRELSLVETPDGLRLAQQPVSEVDDVRWPLTSIEAKVREGAPLIAPLGPDRAFDVHAKFSWEAGSIRRAVLRFHGAPGEWTDVGYAIPESRTYVDRSQSGSAEVTPWFGSAHLGPAEPPGRTALDIRVIVDRSSLEIFIDRGAIVFTEQVFPESWTGVELLVEGGTADVEATVSSIDPGNLIEPPRSGRSYGTWVATAALAALLLVLVLAAYRIHQRREAVRG